MVSFDGTSNAIIEIVRRGSTVQVERGCMARSEFRSGLVLGLMAVVLSIGGCSSDGPVGTRLDRVSTANGIKVTITACEKKPLPDADGGIPQTAFTVKGTVENTTTDPRLGVKVHVTFLDGDKRFYDDVVPDAFTFGGFTDVPKIFSYSVTQSNQPKDLHCKGDATTT